MRERGVMEREVGRNEREKTSKQGRTVCALLKCCDVLYLVRQFPTQSDVREYQSLLENALV